MLCKSGCKGVLLVDGHWSPESPVKFLLRRAAAGHINRQEKLLEVYEPVLITVERSEDVITEVLGRAAREAFAVDLHEGLPGEVAVRTVLLEPLVPLDYGVLGVVGVVGQELYVLLGQAVLRLLSGIKHV